MAAQIGIVKALIGTATATAADGTVRNLQIGDQVFADDLITTGANGAIELEFADGNLMDLGRNSQAVLDDNVFNPVAATEVAESSDADVAAIQAALLAGADPTQAGEATAAGAGVTGDGNEGHTPVVVDYLAPEAPVDSGFDTTGIGVVFPEIQEELQAPVEEPVLPIVDVNEPEEPVDNAAPVGGGDSYSIVEGKALTISARLDGVLGNDTDSNQGNAILTISSVAANSNGSGAFNLGQEFTTALGGKLTIQSDGTFTYDAPVRDHDDTDGTSDGEDVDYFYYKSTDGTNESEWTQVKIDVTNTVPDAVNDVNGTDVEGQATGNVISNDISSQDNPITVVNIDGEPVPTTGDVQIQGDYGLLTISANGEYTYKYNVEATNITIGTDDLAGATLSGFIDTSPLNEDGSLNLNAEGNADVGTHGGSGSNKEGFGVNPAGNSNASGTLDHGEYLLYELGTAVVSHFSFVIGEYNANQTSANEIIWTAFDESGQVISTGDMTGGSNNNGVYTSRDIQIDGEVKFIEFHTTDTTGNGITVMEVNYTYQPTGIDDFVYTIEDSDGDNSTATLSITSDDYLVGNADVNTLTGSDGDDILIGGAGDDILTGGAGADIFDFNEVDFGTLATPASDEITDFNEVDGDVIDLSDVLANSENTIAGIESDGHLQIQVTNSVEGGVLQTIDVSSIAVVDDAAAQAMLTSLIGTGAIDDGI